MPQADDISVPQNMQAVYDEVTRVTDDFCKTLLDEEYALVCRKIAAALCRKRPSPLAQGNLTHWVAGIIHAAGFVNFLWDKSQKPYMRAAEISERFGISNNTVSLKSKDIQRALRLGPLDPRYCLPSRLADNPLAWMVQVNGCIVDVRHMHKAIQEEALRKGLIPCLPEDLPKLKPEALKEAQPEKESPVAELGQTPNLMPKEEGPTLFSGGNG